MKYGLLTYLPTAEQRNWKHNLGDFIQSIAIRNLYEKMGIRKEDIIYVNLFELDRYDGEYCVLPINCYNVPYREGTSYLPPSDKIIPVYISFNLIGGTISRKTVKNLSTYQPISCRDEATMLLLRKYGIQSYLTGCVTVTLPKRKVAPKKSQVYVIDIPDKVIPHIPPHLLKHAKFKTQLIVDNEKPNENRIKELNQLAMATLEELSSKATLVITRRMHVASPCIAMGIPVILVRDDFDTRYAWIERYIHPYCEAEYGVIDWNPVSVDFEAEKKKLIDLYISKIFSTYESQIDMIGISEEFECRERCLYNHTYIKLLKDIEKTNNKPEKMYVIIWGIFVHLPHLLGLIPEYLKNYELVIVDTYMKGEFEEHKIHKPEFIHTLPDNAICIVTAPAIIGSAKSILEGTEKRMIILDCYDK